MRTQVPARGRPARPLLVERALLVAAVAPLVDLAELEVLDVGGCGAVVALAGRRGRLVVLAVVHRGARTVTDVCAQLVPVDAVSRVGRGLAVYGTPVPTPRSAHLDELAGSPVAVPGTAA